MVESLAKKTRWRLCLATWLVALSGLMLNAAHAGEAAPLADDLATEARMITIATELRCLVCQNQTIADSNAGLAVDLRNQSITSAGGASPVSMNRCAISPASRTL